MKQKNKKQKEVIPVPRKKKAALLKPPPATIKALPATAESGSGIVVITHNGKEPMCHCKPKNGGLRLGYQVGNFFIPVGQFVTFQINQESETETGSKLLKAAAYENLPMALDEDCKCCNCRYDQNVPTLVSTEKGWQAAIICSKCNLQMRPYVPEHRWR